MRRVIVAAALMVVLAAGAFVMDEVMNIGQPSPCANLNPDTNWFQWWYYGCDSTAGGGGSGAGQE